jgi:hypothetical protein
MLTQDALNHVNGTILREASKLCYTVSDSAPSSESELFGSTSLVVWSGASERTIFQDPAVNYAFRALHDAFHLKTGIGFTPDEESILGHLQASRYESRLMRALIIAEVSSQALYFKDTGLFVPDQVVFTYNLIKENV